MSIVQQLRSSNGAETHTDTLLRREADRLGCEMAVLQAVLDVESKGASYDRDGRLILLPEKHVFYRELPKSKRGRAVALGLAAKRWKKANYKGLGKSGSDARWDRLQAMADLDVTAALKSCSYGLAQIMGFNFAQCGYRSAQEFVLGLASSTEAQVKAFLAFLENSGLRDALRAKDFRAIARIYNGKGQVDYYAGLLQQAYAKFAALASPASGFLEKDQPRSNAQSLATGYPRLGSSGYRIEALQKRLAALGYVCPVDGDFGPTTRRAVVSLQVDHSLKPDGVVGPLTETTLEQAVPHNQKAGQDRSTLSVKDLRKNGSQTIKKADGQTRIGQVLMGTGLGASAMGETTQGLLEGFGTGAEQLSQLRYQLAPLMEFVSGNKWVLIAAAGFGIWYLARGIKQRRLADAQSWRHVG
ncbi:N-acetylmuramidase domain-containing protein [Pseudovibrio sp. Tun.PSC04-5.I4]|uniref:N-acetylmuramidase domain-containing protein n=1 Tax=Pseudovibrio sp. Tun.PSC04-5.I4 TaxID=1798213 RepID=UPI00089271BF|nr:N-acetylmuramidase domain-containing protein [Pseudovibrio sp. Tun.PSC04-5.I4]SDR15813.1 Putative peptidoglycan binding domain-containing protein [Pseudovibrio sp. Tun.PSC04-5.I4]SDR40429.1 Putative peptidoglycan binding domain-containing protein [Pseudovibrio sp. Tun.PSC04-5.I4]